MRRLLLTFLLTCLAPAIARAEAPRYSLDPVHTQILFQVSHLGFSHSLGWLRGAEGQFRFDSDDWSRSMLEVEAAVSGLDMGDARWNRMLLGRRFFDADNHPRLRYVATRVTQTGADTGLIEGELTLLGLTRPLQLQIRHNRSGINRYNMRYVSGFSATGILSRAEWGMTAMNPAVGDRVYLHIEVEGLREQSR